MISWQQPTIRPWLRAVAFLTAFVFAFTSVVWDGGQRAYAAAPKLSAPIEEGVLHPAILAERPDLPDSYGTIKSTFKGTRDQILIHVQDAHINEEAQRNIANILRYFSEKYQLGLVNLEGASGELDTALFSFFPNKQARTNVADYFLREGRLTGPEYLTIVEKPVMTLNGVEDPELYEENRRAYVDALSFKDRDEKLLLELNKVLEYVSRFVFSEEMRELIRRRVAFQDGGRELVSYVRYLVELARKYKVSLDGYASMHSLLELVDLERQIDFDKAEKETDSLINDLKRLLSRDKLARFLTNTVHFRMKKMKRAAYYTYLEDEIQGISVTQPGGEDLTSKYANVFTYIKYMKLYDSIDVAIFDEIDGLEKTVKNRLFTSPEQVRLDHLIRIHDIYTKMFDFTLTKQDAEFYYTYQDEFKAATFSSFLKPLLKQYRFSLGLPSKMETLDQDLPRVERFYKAALQRDQVLIERAVEKTLASGVKISAIVTGGFHTPGIEKFLREKDLSYIVVAPRITKAIDKKKEDELYDAALRETPLSVEKVLAEAFLQPKSPVLNDPRFQLAAKHMVNSKGETPSDLGKAELRLTVIESLQGLKQNEIPPAVEAMRKELRALPQTKSAIELEDLLNLMDQAVQSTLNGKPVFLLPSAIPGKAYVIAKGKAKQETDVKLPGLVKGKQSQVFRFSNSDDWYAIGLIDADKNLTPEVQQRLERSGMRETAAAVLGNLDVSAGTLSGVRGARVSSGIANVVEDAYDEAVRKTEEKAKQERHEANLKILAGTYPEVDGLDLKALFSKPASDLTEKEKFFKRLLDLSSGDLTARIVALKGFNLGNDIRLLRFAYKEMPNQKEGHFPTLEKKIAALKAAVGEDVYAEIPQDTLNTILIWYGADKLATEIAPKIRLLVEHQIPLSVYMVRLKIEAVQAKVAEKIAQRKLMDEAAAREAAAAAAPAPAPAAQAATAPVAVQATTGEAEVRERVAVEYGRILNAPGGAALAEAGPTLLFRLLSVRALKTLAVFTGVGIVLAAIFSFLGFSVPIVFGFTAIGFAVAFWRALGIMLGFEVKQMPGTQAWAIKTALGETFYIGGKVANPEAGKYGELKISDSTLRWRTKVNLSIKEFSEFVRIHKSKAFGESSDEVDKRRVGVLVTGILSGILTGAIAVTLGVTGMAAILPIAIVGSIAGAVVFLFWEGVKAEARKEVQIAGGRGAFFKKGIAFVLGKTAHILFGVGYHLLDGFFIQFIRIPIQYFWLGGRNQRWLSDEMAQATIKASEKEIRDEAGKGFWSRFQSEKTFNGKMLVLQRTPPGYYMWVALQMSGIAGLSNFIKNRGRLMLYSQVSGVALTLVGTNLPVFLIVMAGVWSFMAIRDYRQYQELRKSGKDVTTGWIVRKIVIHTLLGLAVFGGMHMGLDPTLLHAGVETAGRADLATRALNVFGINIPMPHMGPQFDLLNNGLVWNTPAVDFIKSQTFHFTIGAFGSSGMLNFLLQYSTQLKQNMLQLRVRVATNTILRTLNPSLNPRDPRAIQEAVRTLKNQGLLLESGSAQELVLFVQSVQKSDLSPDQKVMLLRLLEQYLSAKAFDLDRLDSSVISSSVDEALLGLLAQHGSPIDSRLSELAPEAVVKRQARHNLLTSRKFWIGMVFGTFSMWFVTHEISVIVSYAEKLDEWLNITFIAPLVKAIEGDHDKQVKLAEMQRSGEQPTFADTLGAVGLLGITTNTVNSGVVGAVVGGEHLVLDGLIAPWRERRLGEDVRDMERDWAAATDAATKNALGKKLVDLKMSKLFWANRLTAAAGVTRVADKTTGNVQVTVKIARDEAGKVVGRHVFEGDAGSEPMTPYQLWQARIAAAEKKVESEAERVFGTGPRPGKAEYVTMAMNQLRAEMPQPVIAAKVAEKPVVAKAEPVVVKVAPVVA
ncbi:MAG TPA: hypothetical protein PLL75_05050, partial [Candidatus Omnitrophota bacterium]|nr:hypothetical protein [Candidatus Omnitrophota bacterium]